MKINDAWYCPDCDEVFGLADKSKTACPCCTNRSCISLNGLLANVRRAAVQKIKEMEKEDEGKGSQEIEKGSV